MMRGGIAFAGTIVHDKIYSISEFPSLGALSEIIGVESAVGGLVPNDAIDMKKLSPSLPVYALGRVGDDESGRFCLDYMRKAGVDVSEIRVAQGSVTGFTNVMSILGGQRTFFTHSGANDEFCYEDINWDSLKASMLHLGYFLLLRNIDSGDGIRILKEAKRRGIKTSIDFITSTKERYQGLDEVLKYVDNLVVNEQEAGALAGIEPDENNLGEIASSLLEKSSSERIIVHSPRLSVCASRNGVVSLGSYELPCNFIKGTTGAGDAFCAGALLGIYEEKSDIEILEMATLAATASLRSHDATGAVCEIGELRKEFSGYKRRSL